MLTSGSCVLCTQRLTLATGDKRCSEAIRELKQRGRANADFFDPSSQIYHLPLPTIMVSLTKQNKNLVTATFESYP